MSKEITHENFNCPILGSIAHLEIEYLVREFHRIEPLPAEKIVVGFHCHDCLSCGVVVTEQSATSRSYNWASCPAHSIFSKRGTR